eukprot:gene518-8031_t
MDSKQYLFLLFFLTIFYGSFSLTNPQVYTFGRKDDGPLCLGEISTDKYSPTEVTSSNQENTVDIEAGSKATFLLKSSGRVFACGKNDRYQLGDGSEIKKYTPVLSSSLGLVNKVSNGDSFTMVINTVGGVYGLGKNNKGQLGNGLTSYEVSSLVGFTSPTNFAFEKISAGKEHTLILKNGSVYSYGSQEDGRCGDNDSSGSRKTPYLIPNQYIIDISAGEKHSLIVNDQGTVFSFGKNEYGQLGLGDTIKRIVPTIISTIDKIKRVFAGGRFSLVLRTTGRVYSFGDHDSNELGIGHNNNKQKHLYPVIVSTEYNYRIIDACVGERFSLIMNDKGKVYSFGKNNVGQLGIGFSNRNADTRLARPLTDTNQGIFKVACGYEHSVVLKYTASCYGKSHDNEAVCSGNGLCTATDTCSCASGYSGTECASYSCFGVLSTVSSVCSGFGTCSSPNLCSCMDGRDGTNCEVDLNQNSYNHTKVYSFGKNDFGQLAIGTTEDTSIPTKVTLNNYGITNIYSGESHVFMKNHLSKMYSAGNNQYGELLLEQDFTYQTTLKKVQRPFYEIITSATGGENYSMVLTNNGVYSVGNGDLGRLGISSTENVLIPILVTGTNGVTQISSSQHSLILFNDGTVKSFGKNANGRLGDGSTTNRNSPVPLDGSALNISQISAGGAHSVILDVDGYVYSFGYNIDGQLGDGTNTDKRTRVQITGINKIKSIAAGGRFSLLLDVDGQVLSMGSNGYGQIGMENDFNNRIVPTMVFNGNNVTQIAVGNAHSIIVKSTGIAYGFGLNGNGQLGIPGNTKNQKHPSILVRSHGPVISVSAKTYSTWMIVDESISCFGKTSADPTVCNGNGVCASKDICTCDNRYSGLQCEFWSCHGLNTSNPLVCSGIKQGTCESPDLCLCTKLFDGKECDQNITKLYTAYSFGINTYGQIGDGSVDDRTTPFKIGENITGITSLGVGDSSVYAFTEARRGFSCGRNEYSELLDENYQQSKRLKEIDPQNFDISQISAGDEYVLMIKTSGVGYGIGKNEVGQLGVGSIGHKTTLIPFDMINNNNITKVAAYNVHSIILRDGAVYSFGEGKRRRLGLGSSEDDKSSPTLITTSIGTTIDICVGSEHSLLLNNEGKVFSFGHNKYGQTGQGTTSGDTEIPTAVKGFYNQDIIKISCGGDHSVMLNKYGEVFSFGRASKGEMGDGYNPIAQLFPVKSYSPFNIIDIAAGHHFTLILKENGKLYSFGENSNGQLGIGHKLSPQNTPQQIAIGNIVEINAGKDMSLILQSNHNCSGRSYDDPVVCSGRGICDSLNHCSCPKEYHGDECQFTTCHGKNSSDPTVCSSHGKCDLLDECTCNTGYSGLQCELNYNTEIHTLVHASGEKNEGQLGDGSNSTSPTTTFQLVSTENHFVSKIFAGFENSFLVKNFSRKVFGFGKNSKGELNDGTTLRRTLPVIMNDQRNEIEFVSSSGEEFMLILYKNKNVFGVGENGMGQLGVGHKADIHTLQPMIGTNYDVKKICTGYQHSMVLKDNTKVYTFGRNDEKQLGQGNVQEQIQPVEISNSHTNIIEIACGQKHNLILKNDGHAYGFGSNQYGQLGIGSSNNEKDIATLVDQDAGGGFLVKHIFAGEYFSMLITRTGSLMSFGNNNAYQLGIGNTNSNTNVPTLVSFSEKIYKVVCGGFHSAIITTTGKLYTFGNNHLGQLATGDTTHRYVPTLNSLSPVMDIAVGHRHTLALQSRFSCAGKAYDNTTICSGKGICVGTDTCVCDPDRFGNDCQFYTCFEIAQTDPSVCSGRGTCITTDNCVCKTGSSGINCQDYTCFSVNSTLANVCSSQGTCIEIDTCSCNLTYLGSNCETKIDPRIIYPISSQILTTSTQIFKLNSTTTIESIIKDNLECRIGNKTTKIVVINEYMLQCEVTVNNPEDILTIWYSGNQSFILTTNSIKLMRFENVTIGYNSTSQVGLTKNDNNIHVEFINTIPSYYQSRIYCSINDSLVKTTQIDQNVFTCLMNVEKDDIYAIGLKFISPNQFFLSNIPGYFQEKYTINISSTLNKLDVVSLQLNTQGLIDKKMMKENCEDLTVTYKDQPIARQVENCNNLQTSISFVIEENSEFTQEYSIYYNNEFQVVTNITISGDPKIVSSSFIKVNNTIWSLSANELKFRAVPFVTIDKVTPELGLITTKNVTLTSNIAINNLGYLDYQLIDGESEYPAVMNSNNFYSYISSNVSQKLNISIYAVHKTTKEKLLVSSSSSFYFWSSLNLVELYPFVDKFNISSPKKTKTISVRSNEDILSDYKLFCKFTFKSNVTYAKGTKFNQNLIKCDLSVDLSLNTEVINVGLTLNQSNNMIDLHVKSAAYVFIKEPISLNGLNKTLLPTDYEKYFTLDFDDVRHSELVSFSNYSYIMNPELHSSIMVNCSFNSTARCVVPEFQFKYVPVKISSSLKIHSQFHSEPFSINVDALFHKEPVSISQEYPYLIDLDSYIKNSISITFNTTKSLNPAYPFHCKYQSFTTKAELINFSQFKCDFFSNVHLLDYDVSLYLNDSNSIGLDGRISNIPNIRFSKILYQPNFVEINGKELIKLIQNTTELTIPVKYQGNTFEVITVENGIKYGCSVINSSLYCQKEVINAFSSSDIYFLRFNILQNNLELTKIAYPLLVFKNNTIQSILPLATLINSEANLTVVVDKNTFLRNISVSSDIYCKDSNSHKWKAIVNSRKEVNCKIPYSDHNTTTTNIEVVLSVPSYTPNDISLTMNTIPLYYLTQNSISFSSFIEPQFEYTSTILSVSVTIDTFIPESLKKKIVCRLSDSNFDHITYFSYSNGNIHSIICNFTTDIPGAKNMSIYYKDDFHEFSISNNSLELIFVTPQAITSISPSGIKINKTKDLTITTLFDTSLDYGFGRLFYCEYGLTGGNTTLKPVSSFEGGKFICTVNILSAGSAFLKLHLKTKGTLKFISLKTEIFRVVDGNILEPSFGTPEGGKTLRINDYELPVSFNAIFKKESLSTYQFNCSKNGTVLICTTPKILNNDMLPFSSEFLQLTNNNSISSSYILYGTFFNSSVNFLEQRNIQEFNPKVIPATVGSVEIDLILSNQTKLYEGNLFLVLAEFTKFEARYNLGNFSTPSQTLSQIVDSISSGVYKLQISYFHPESFELGSMFRISEQVNITFTGVSSIQLVTSKDIFYLNNNENITVEITTIDSLKLNEMQKNFIRCKLDNQILPTTRLGSNQFICSLTSNSAKDSRISMVYQNSDAHNNQVLLSSNSIQILFIEKVIIHSITPFSTLESEIRVLLNTTSNLNYDATYQCNFGVNKFSALKITTNIFECNVTKGFINQYATNVTLDIVSIGKKLKIPLSENSVEFYFMNQIEIISISPHVLEFASAPFLLSKTITMNLKTDLLVKRTVFCKFTTNDGTISFSEVHFVSTFNSKQIYCLFTKNLSVNTVQHFDVQLFMQPSNSYEFILSSNNDTALILPNLIHWKTSRLVHLKDSFIMLDFMIPNRKFIYEIHSMAIINGSLSTMLSCTFDYFSSPNCTIPIDYLNNLKTVPLNLNFTYHISHKNSNITQYVSIDDVVYYQDIIFQHLKPFVVSPFERKYNPVRVISNVNYALNNEHFSIFSNVSSNGISKLILTTYHISNDELESNLTTKGHLAFSFNTFGNEDNVYDVQITFKSAFGDAILTPKAHKIYSIVSPIYQPTFGPDSGEFDIKIPFKQPNINYDGYNYTIQTLVDGTHVQVGNCNLNLTNLDCHILSTQHLSKSRLFFKLKFEVFINNVRALGLTPYFTFYKGITISEFSPTTVFKIHGDGYFHLTTSTFVEKFGSFTIRYSMNETILEESCVTKSPTKLLCKVPSFNKTSDVSMKISQGGYIYQSIGMKLSTYDPSNITFDGFSPSTISYSSQTIIFVSGTNFFNAPNITIKVHDVYVTKFIKGIYVSNTLIKAEMNPLYDLDIAFPRELSISLSLDGGLHYFTHSKHLTVTRSKKIEFIPKFVPTVGKTLGIVVKNFPSDLFFNSTKFDVKYYLTQNESNKVEIFCSYNFDLQCNLTSTLIQGYYKLKVSLMDENDKTTEIFINTNDIYAYDLQVSKIEPQRLLLNKDTQVKVVGSWTNSIFRNVLFRITYQKGGSLFATPSTAVVKMNATVSDHTISTILPKFEDFTVSDVKIEFSFNDFNYHSMDFIGKLSLYEINSIVNLDGRDNNFLTFSNSRGKFIGKYFVNTGVDLKIVLDLTTKFDLTPFANITYISDTEISFIFPNISRINIPHTLGYPLKTKLGLSLNGGNDYIYGEINYLDAFPQPVFTAINPSYAPIGDKNVTIYGIDLDLVYNCSIFDGSNVLLYQDRPTNYELDSNFITCLIPAKFQTQKLTIKLTNEEGDINANSREIEFYIPPVLTETIPNSGISQGGFKVSVFGTGFPEPPETVEISCRFGNIVCRNPCKWISSTKLVCTSEPHPAASTLFSISYNKVDWHDVTQLFTFTPCEAGKTASSYTEACFLCPPGTFKPAAGLFDCIKCEEDTYNSFSGSLKCDKCEGNTTTNGLTGAITHNQCICQPGYYKNPETETRSNSHQKCIECPSGAICPEYNTTVPFAKPGFWRSKTDYTTYYSCLPEDSCGGFGAENCTEGYAGARCAFGSILKLVKLRIKYIAPPADDEYSDEEVDENGQTKKKKKNIIMKVVKLIKSIILGIIRTINEHANMFGTFNVPWNVEYQYKPLNFKTDSESPEDSYTHMNQIFNDLLSIERLRKNLFSFEKKAIYTRRKIIKRLRKNTDVDDSSLNKEDVEKIKKNFKQKMMSKSKIFGRSSNIISTGRTDSNLSESDLNRENSSVRLVSSKNLSVLNQKKTEK